MSAEKHQVENLEQLDIGRKQEDGGDPDAEFGGTEERKRLEKKLLLKLDLRMSVLIVIYILNYVSSGSLSILHSGG